MMYSNIGLTFHETVPLNVQFKVNFATTAYITLEILVNKCAGVAASVYPCTLMTARRNFKRKQKYSLLEKILSLKSSEIQNLFS